MAKFVSRQRNFRVFLKMEDSGGRWADFGEAGECETKNPEDAEKLRNVPGFGQDFYEVGHVEESSDKYKCPFCDYTADNQRKIVTHSTFKKDDCHKKISPDDVLVV